MLSDLLELRTVNWLLQKTITILFVALPIVFLPELEELLSKSAVEVYSQAPWDCWRRGYSNPDF